jgi:hypothetical protein
MALFSDPEARDWEAELSRALGRGDVQHCYRVAAGGVLLTQHRDSESIEPFAA